MEQNGGTVPKLGQIILYTPFFCHLKNSSEGLNYSKSNKGKFYPAPIHLYCHPYFLFELPILPFYK